MFVQYSIAAGFFFFQATCKYLLCLGLFGLFSWWGGQTWTKHLDSNPVKTWGRAAGFSRERSRMHLGCQLHSENVLLGASHQSLALMWEFVAKTHLYQKAWWRALNNFPLLRNCHLCMSSFFSTKGHNSELANYVVSIDIIYALQVASDFSWLFFVVQRELPRSANKVDLSSPHPTSPAPPVVTLQCLLYSCLLLLTAMKT